MIVSMQQLDVVEYRDLWTSIVAQLETKEKNEVRSVCIALRDISSRNNPALYLCDSLVLSENQKRYAIEFALYNRLPTARDKLCKNVVMHTMDHLLLGEQSITVLAAYKDSFYKQQPCFFSVPRYLVAAYYGDIDYLKEYCANQENEITAGSCDNRLNILHIAAELGHTAVVELLLKHPCIKDLINQSDQDHYKPLHYASSYLITQLLFQHPAIDIDAHDRKDSFGSTPAEVACMDNQRGALQFFIEHKPEWLHNAPGYILEQATKNGWVDAVKIISENQSDEFDSMEGFDLF